MQVTESLFLAYCQCSYKAFLKSKGEAGEVSELEQIQKVADERFKDEAIERLLRNHEENSIARGLSSLGLAVKEGTPLILGAVVEALGAVLSLDVLERLADCDDDRRAIFKLV
jgi:hypothetical protein